MNEGEFKTELRLNNVIFYCNFEKRYYNAKLSKCYAIAFIQGVIPQGSSYQMSIGSLTICEGCFQTKLSLEEPSPIQKPNGKDIDRFKKRN